LKTQAYQQYDDEIFETVEKVLELVIDFLLSPGSNGVQYTGLNYMFYFLLVIE
jgi:hypothetical protein